IATVAEGVETQRQINYLQKLGVDYLQGYYFSKAMSLREFISKPPLNIISG
ncbi:EAL domain-containing protein, partial [Escherichia coli]